MAKPNLTWAAYNLFRIAALVFISWTLVAQFISLAEDMDAVSRAVSIQSLGSASTATAAAAGSSSAIGWSAIGTLSSPFNVKTASIPVPDPATPTAAATPTIVGGPGPVVDTELVPIPTDAAGLPPLIGHQGRRAVSWYHRKRDESRDQGDADEYVPGSSVPNQPGGGAFVVLARLAMVGLLGLTASAQAGLPETFLYNRLSWLGPQSTPLWLGILQFILAIENLRVYSRADLMVGSWGLLAFGSANIIIGLLLSWLGRRLPKHPPHALYFNRSTRLLFFRPDPPFYAQLDTQQSRTEEPSFADVEKATVKRAFPPSNAHEIGLDYTGVEDDHEPEWKMVTPPKRGRPTQNPTYKSEEYDSMDPRDRPVPRPSKTKKKSKKESVASGLHATLGNQVLPAVRAPEPMQGLRPEQDVAQGGYPTFASGGGLNDPRRQVPTGVVEQSGDGRAVRFIKEDGREAGQTGPNVDFGAREQAGTSMQGAQPMLLAPITGDGDSQPGLQKTKEGKPQRKSSLDAAAELAPRFPVPPTRANSAPGQGARGGPRTSQKSNLAVNTTAAVPPSRAARLRQILSPTGGGRPARSVSADAQPGDQTRHGTHAVVDDDDDADPELVIELADEAREDGLDELASPAITPGSGASKSPYTPVLSAKQHVATVVKLSRADSRSVTPSTAPTTGATSAPQVTDSDAFGTAQTAFVGEPEPLEPSEPQNKRPVARQSSMRRGSDARPPSKGVRFDLTDVEEVTEPESSPSPPMTSASPPTPPKTGLRIPGTNIHLPLPFASPLPAPPTRTRLRDSRRFSSDSMASFGDISASDTDGFFTPSEPLQTSGDGRPELLARQSSETLASVDARRPDPGSKPARPQSALILRSALKSENSAEKPRRRSSVSFA